MRFWRADACANSRSLRKKSQRNWRRTGVAEMSRRPRRAYDRDLGGTDAFSKSWTITGVPSGPCVIQEAKRTRPRARRRFKLAFMAEIKA